MEHVPYYVQAISDRVNVVPEDIHLGLDNAITCNARKKLEGRVCASGYVRPNSVLLLSRTTPRASHHFQGQLTVDVELVCDICRPGKGDLILCKVLKMNECGLRANAGEYDELYVYVFREHHNDCFDDPALREQCYIEAEVIRISECRLNEARITVMAKIKRVFELMSLQDYKMKTVSLPSLDEDDTKHPIDLQGGDRPPPSEAALGYELFVGSIRGGMSRLPRTDDLEDSMRVLNLSIREVEDDGRETRDSKIYREARSFTNDFELVYPPRSYHAPMPGSFRPIDRAFFKLWEIFRDFNVLPPLGQLPKGVFVHLAESPGGFAEATLRWRQGINGDVATSLDKVFVMSLRSATSSSPGIPAAALLENGVFATHPDFHIIYGGEDSFGQGNGTGDIFNLGNLTDLGDEVKRAGGADFVTADLGFDFGGVEQSREQCMLFPVFAQIFAIVTVQKAGGCAVLKLFDVFTWPMARLIALGSSFYEEAFLTKPYSSRISNPERYLVLKGRKPVDEASIANLRDAFKAWQGLEPSIGSDYARNSQFVTDLSSPKLSRRFIEALFAFNHTNVVQRQMRALSEMLHYMSRSKTSLEVRNARFEQQRRSAEMWLRRYMKRQEG